MATVFQRMQYALSGTTAGRRFQEQMDIATIAMLTHLKELHVARGPGIVSPEEKEALFEQAVEAMESKTFEEHKAVAQTALTKQVEAMFSALVLGNQVLQQKPNVFSITAERPATSPHTTIEGYVQDHVGFSLQVQDSTIDNAGRGLFLQGTAVAGTLVALYPGTVYLSEHYRKKYFDVVSNNPFARARFDGAIINAKDQVIPHANHYALAQMVNHPPAGTSPNVLPVAFDFPAAEPFTSDAFAPYIPNRYVEQPSLFAMFGKRGLVPGIALVTLHDVTDEELFLNYRYNPSLPYPEWYTPVDKDADEKMWG
ncbi:hypothetical protein SPRG_12913 [Saprolegnia parasitica CBS 223.65]|uniref:SET domain-containing protein n=1 Tax=Saprolegnia parasitica (strain CBS 223.65) TaxID=695850 RepID=A0A067C2W7_SAPPC|nr:hypothetical protein SPRG_12913 [Saprolegnia parasitica CBS 223.65]KDO21132.1 hypothetical protein SPRG_12913 [Saprolegnia parasitica CBS 223.65]|eukprot:XP_012208133.1 hypothetical protein SPRG_12913 [Saprolegnia parasitica CBS 223.65]